MVGISMDVVGSFECWGGFNDKVNIRMSGYRICA